MLEIVKEIVGPLVAGLSGYYNLPVYGRALYKQARGKVVEYGGEELFWRDAIGPYFYEAAQTKLFEGQLVKLLYFDITEWFPRCPGLFWTAEGHIYRQRAKDYVEDQINKYKHIAFSPRGKSLMILGGIGTTRLEVHTGDEQDYKVLCATSSGRCDAGIPLVVTKPVWEQIRDGILSKGAIKADVSGFYSPLPIKYEDLLIETGTELASELRSFLANSLYLPRYCLLVESSLQLKRRGGISSVQATAWALFKNRNIDAALPFSFTYRSMDAKSENSIKEAAEFIEGYVNEYGGEEILTDFDEKIRRFSSTYPLSEVMKYEIDQSVEQRRIFESAELLDGFESGH